MKARVIYFSLDKNTQFIAQHIAQVLCCDCEEITPVEAYESKGISKMLKGGKDVMFKKTPPLNSYSKDFEDCLIILGTPVWAGNITPPIRTFLSENDFSGKKFALFTSSGGGGNTKCIETLKALVPNCELISVESFVSPLSKDKEEQLNKAEKWAKSLGL